MIVNPAAGKGAARRRLQEVSQIFAAFDIRDIKETARRGDEARVTLEAVDAGWDVIIVVGGDGTCSRVAETLVRSAAHCALTVLPSGTGNDFAKTLGLADASPEQVAALATKGNVARVDVGRADEHYFINSCGFGFDASVLDASTRVRLLRGDAVYIYAALAQLFTYRGETILIDGEGGRRGETLMLTVSNGRSLGGVFRIAPHASVVDGQLDVCVIRDAGVVERIGLFVAALKGAHEQMPSVATFRTEDMALTFTSPPSIELDGELRQAPSTEVRVECVPGALKVVAADGAKL